MGYISWGRKESDTTGHTAQAMGRGHLRGTPWGGEEACRIKGNEDGKSTHLDTSRGPPDLGSVASQWSLAGSGPPSPQPALIQILLHHSTDTYPWERHFTSVCLRPHL